MKDPFNGGDQNQLFKLDVHCSQSFTAGSMQGFLKSYGSLNVFIKGKAESGCLAEAFFDSKINAEKVFSIWNQKYAVPFQGVLTFSKDTSPNDLENEPTMLIIIVKGLSLGANEIAIFDLFRPFGSLYSCRVEYSTDSNTLTAFVQYYDLKATLAAISNLNHSNFNGDKLSLETISFNKPEKYSLAHSDCKTIKISGFTQHVESSFIYNVFTKAGSISDIDVIPTSGLVFVTFQSAVSASSAIELFNKKFIEDFFLSVTLSEESTEPNSQATSASILEALNNPSFSIPPSMPPTLEISKEQGAPSTPLKLSALEDSNNGIDFNAPSCYSLGSNCSPHNNLSDFASISEASYKINALHNSRIRSFKETPKHRPISPNNTTITFEEFKQEKLYDVICNFTKHLSLGSEANIQAMVLEMFESDPSAVAHLARSMLEFKKQTLQEEKKLMKAHQFSYSDKSYRLLQRIQEDDPEGFSCNPEFLPLHPQRESELKSILEAPQEIGFSLMLAMLEKRLSGSRSHESLKIAKYLTKKCSFRLLMVSYCYDEVLEDLVEKYFPS